MKYLDPQGLILMVFFIYFLSACMSLFLIKVPKIGPVLIQSLCAIASLLGIIAIIRIFLLHISQLSIVKVNTFIPLITIHLELDSLSAIFVLALFILTFCISIYSLGYQKHFLSEKRNIGLFNFLYVLFILSMGLVFVAKNFVVFIVSWELMALISYFLVVFESEKEANQRAGTLYLIMTHVGSAMLVIAMMIGYSYSGTFEMGAIGNHIPVMMKNSMFVLFVIGFGTKGGLIPLHIWLPAAHPAAPANISALMSGIMIKTSVYGIFRFVLLGLGVQFAWWGELLLVLGMVSMVLGVSYAMMATNIKKLLAYCSIENIGIIWIAMGVVLIGAAKNNPALTSLAVVTAILHTVNHAFYKAGLFMGAGSIQSATHTMEMEELGGLIKKMPMVSFLLLCFSLAISAMPPFNGFVSEWLLIQSLFAMTITGGAFLRLLTIIVVATIGLASALAAGSFIKFFGVTFLGKPRSDKAEREYKQPQSMNIGMGILAIICLAGGIFPVAAIHVINRTVLQLSGTQLIGVSGSGWIWILGAFNNHGNIINSWMVLSVLIVTAIITFVILKLFWGGDQKRIFNTWDCGFHTMTSRMQYSATGFSKPIRIALKIIYRPNRAVKITPGKSPYHPASMEYITDIEPVFEKYLYRPAMRLLRRFSMRAKLTIQTGRIHSYLLYIFITLLILMLYNRFS